MATPRSPQTLPLVSSGVTQLKLVLKDTKILLMKGLKQQINRLTTFQVRILIQTFLNVIQVIINVNVILGFQGF